MGDGNGLENRRATSLGGSTPSHSATVSPLRHAVSEYLATREKVKEEVSAMQHQITELGHHQRKLEGDLWRAAQAVVKLMDERKLDVVRIGDTILHKASRMNSMGGIVYDIEVSSIEEA